MARDKYHQHVREALEKDGWEITHDPYKILIGRRKGYIELGAEIIAAEKGIKKIAVEIKSFLGHPTFINLKMPWVNSCCICRL